MQPVNPNKIDHIWHENAPCAVTKSEARDQFVSPPKENTECTRAKYYETFLWHTFYEEYIRSKNRVESIVRPPTTTEYYDEFGKPSPLIAMKLKENEDNKERLENLYPLYSTVAITSYNHAGEPTCTFKRKCTITVPTSLQKGKFDD